MFFGLFGKSRIILNYNGTEYKLREGDIPRLEGSGTITIINYGAGNQLQVVDGNFNTSILCVQDDKRQYLNHVDLAELVKKLEARKASGR